MSDSDQIMQGFVISTFVLCGLSSIVYCIRLRLKDRAMMKQSPSMEDLNSIVISEDPSV